MPRLAELVDGLLEIRQVASERRLIDDGRVLDGDVGAAGAVGVRACERGRGQRKSGYGRNEQSLQKSSPISSS